MIEMGVSQNDVFDLCRANRERCPVAQAELLESLKETAVHKGIYSGGAQQILRAGYRADSAEKFKGQ